MMAEPQLRQFLVLGAWASIIGIRMNGYATARHKQSCHLDISGIHQTNQVLHDDIDTILMEIAMIAETEKIQFQALALHHSDIGYVLDDDLSEIGLTCNRA